MLLARHRPLSPDASDTHKVLGHHCLVHLKSDPLPRALIVEKAHWDTPVLSASEPHVKIQEGIRLAFESYYLTGNGKSDSGGLDKSQRDYTNCFLSLADKSAKTDRTSLVKHADKHRAITSTPYTQLCNHLELQPCQVEPVLVYSQLNHLSTHPAVASQPA